MKFYNNFTIHFLKNWNLQFLIKINFYEFISWPPTLAKWGKKVNKDVKKIGLKTEIIYTD